MCCRFNPCFCCPVEVGVYILSMTHSLYITGAFVLGIFLGYETVMVFLQSNLPMYENAFRLTILIWYSLCFLVEVSLREYLYTTMDMSRSMQIQRCKFWIRLKLGQIITAIPFIILHLYIELTDLKLILYTIVFIYHIYYTWVVHHYLTFEILGKNDPILPLSSTAIISVDPGVPLSSLQRTASKMQTA